MQLAWKLFEYRFELRQPDRQFDYTLDQLREGKPELTKKKRQKWSKKLHEELSWDIRRYVYLKHLRDFPQITIHTDAASAKNELKLAMY